MAPAGTRMAVALKMSSTMVPPESAVSDAFAVFQVPLGWFTAAAATTNSVPFGV